MNYGGKQRPFRKRSRSGLRKRPIVAYDLETTRIEAGTPEPLYFTMTGRFQRRTQTVAEKTVGMDALADCVKRHMLTDGLKGTRFVGYNANRFDALIIARAIASDPAFHVEPWLAGGGQFRGMSVVDSENPKRFWHFSDAMAMFGFQGNLKDFLAAYAPEQEKLTIDIENFDPDSPEHQRYAVRDAEALYAATMNAAAALENVTGLPVQNTIGRVAVTYFRQNMPDDVNVWQPPHAALDAIHAAKRGGYVYCKEPYRGPVWKYDINQSYAHQMRNPLPSGRIFQTWDEIVGLLGVYRVTISRDEPAAVPFYIRPENRRHAPIHADGTEAVTGWVTSPEIHYLRRHGWKVAVETGWVWSDSFRMTDMVNHLEHERQHCDGGPKGPQGLMIKAVGNNAFGKTLQESDGQRLRVSPERPGDDWFAYRPEDPEFAGIWVQFGDAGTPADYERPQLGTFILAYGRIQLMEAAHLNEPAFIYSDTDGIMFTEDVTDELDIDPARYGAWKLEAGGEPYIVIAKKVYCSVETRSDGETPETRHAKGLHVRELTLADFEAWYSGNVPVQTQVQRQSFLRSFSGAPMFVERTRSGTRVGMTGD